MLMQIGMLLASSKIPGSEGTIAQFLGALQKTVAEYGSILVSIIGLAMVIVGVFQIAKNLISHGKGQNSWVVAIALVIIGGALAVTGGWGMIGRFAKSGRNTLSQMAQGQAETVGKDDGYTNPFDEGFGQGSTKKGP